MQRFMLLAATAALCPSPVNAQVSIEPGFQGTNVLDLSGDRVYGTLADGSYVSFEGLLFEHYGPDGNLLATLGTLPGSVFPSFLEVHPSGAFAIAGESSNGDLFKVDIVNGGFVTLANLNFNFDLAWDTDPGFAYVSAALGGFGAGNDILRLNLSTGATTALVHLAGPSGPIAVDDEGNLHYVTQFDGPGWPPPLEAEELIRWDDADLDSAGPGNLLDEADAVLEVAGLDGGSSMVYDPRSGFLFLAHVNFQGLAQEVLQIDPSTGVLDTVATSFTWIQNLELQNGNGEATLSAYQPLGSRILVQNTDFGGSLRDRVIVEPLRAVATYSGPISGNSGPATITFSGAEPDGAVSVLLARSTNLLPNELVSHLGWVAPVFTAMELRHIARRTFPLQADASGAVSITFQQPATLEGALLFQGIVYDTVGSPLGTTDWVINQ
jgi:hypothetical protein